MQAMEVSLAGIGAFENQPISKSVEAYLKLLKGLELVFRWTKDDNLMARKLYQEAIDIDPEYGSAYAQVGWTYVWGAFRGWSDDPDGALVKAGELGKKAISLGNA